ncbi:MAG: autotransporter-associated N-terminal domain-containing protein, partial [Fusobacteriaceae bacterium]
MERINMEKSLKSFLKRKGSYSLSLLVAFMISGGISLSSEISLTEINGSKSELLAKIQAEREKIKQKLIENEKLIEEDNLEYIALIRKGDFYSKPVMQSTQVFFTPQYIDSGEMKNRTEEVFSETIDAINKKYASSGTNFGYDKVITGNGVAVG